MEIATFANPSLFVALGSAANALKGLAWMAGGSTRAAFNVSFQQDSNIGDITAKATSQTICTSMAGTAAGMALAGGVGQDVWLACAASAALASVHMGAALMYVLKLLRGVSEKLEHQNLIDIGVSGACR